MNISKRVQGMQFSPIRKLAPLGDLAKARGVKVYHLNIGQPDIKTPECFFKALKNYDKKTVAYTNSKGITPLIKSFIKYYKEWNIEFEEDEILITAGGSEALILAIMAICDEGEEIIIPEPFYTNYNSFGDIASVKVVPFITKVEEGFHLPSKEKIEEIVNHKTRAILISNPGNPTGVVYTYDEIRILADICKEKDLYLISDEVYREFVYDGLKYTSAMDMQDMLDRIIIVDSISKRYSACGARIGLVASKNKELINQILKLCQARLCVSEIEQLAAAELINTPKEYLKEVKQEYEKRRNILFNRLSKIPGVICKKPTGAFYVIAKLPIEDAEDFARWMLDTFNYNNKTVMVAPAGGFYATPGLGKNEVRFSYCLNCDDLEEAMDIFGRALEAYKQQK